jgi:hypothetical protein
MLEALRRRAALVAVTALLAAACASADPAAPEPAPDPGDMDAIPTVDPALLQPLTGLGPCEDPPPAAEDVTAVPGLVLPPDSTITSVNDTGPLTQVQGYIERTPIEVRVHYTDGSAGVEVLTVEDETMEVEALLTDGEHRMFLKAQAVCERGSIFVSFVAAAGEGDRLPAPAGGGG